MNKKHYKLNLTADRSKAGVIDCFVDSDWATDKVSRKSTSGGMVLYAGALVLSYSRTQTTVATSSAEAELYATGSGVCEGMLCGAIMKELGEEPQVRVHSDSTAGISAQSRLGLGKMKHVEVRYLFVQGLLRRNRMTLNKVGTFDNISDIGTKPVDQKTLERHMAAMRLAGDEEEHTSLMQVSGERRQVAGDLVRPASMAKHCGGCLVGLGAMLSKAEARGEPTDNGDQDSNIFWKVAGTMVVMWTVLVVILTVKMTRKNPPLVMTTGAQTKKI